MRDLLEEAYQRFASYHPTAPLAICQCTVCMTLAEQRAFLALPLRDIPTGWMSAYVSSVPAADEAAYLAQYRYFLPRLLELLVAGEEVGSLTETALSKMHLAHPLWSAAERNFMRRFAHAFMMEVMHGGIDADNAANYLLMFHWAGVAMTAEFVAMWTAHAHVPAALRHFMALLEYLDVPGDTVDWHRALHLPEYCPDREGFVAILSAWFAAPQTRRAFRDALEATLLAGREDAALTQAWEAWYDWLDYGEK